MTPSPSGDPKVRRITATYYPVPKPPSNMARRMSLIERIKRATTSKESK